MVENNWELSEIRLGAIQEVALTSAAGVGQNKKVVKLPGLVMVLGASGNVCGTRKFVIE